jgi:hypothetical protein
MSKQVGKRVAAATAVVGSLAKAQRQLLAVTYEEAVRRHAKSVQVTFTPKGVLKASVYLECRSLKHPPPIERLQKR